MTVCFFLSAEYWEAPFNKAVHWHLCGPRCMTRLLGKWCVDERSGSREGEDCLLYDSIPLGLLTVEQTLQSQTGPAPEISKRAQAKNSCWRYSFCHVKKSTSPNIKTVWEATAKVWRKWIINHIQYTFLPLCIIQRRKIKRFLALLLAAFSWIDTFSGTKWSKGMLCIMHDSFFFLSSVMWNIVVKKSMCIISYVK